MQVEKEKNENFTLISNKKISLNKFAPFKKM